MLYPIYSVYDSAVGFNPPVVQRSEAFAKRAFAENFRNAFQRSDFVLYQIGDFNEETGEIYTMTPVRICSGSDFMSEVEENGK